MSTPSVEQADEKAERRVLTITHTAEDGTTLDGVSRADDLYHWLRSQGWNRRNSVGDYRLLGSPNKPAKRYAIDRTAEGLRERGFDVHIEIDDAVRAFEDSEADRAANAEQRSERLERSSASLAAAAQVKDKASRAVLDIIPLGQPYITDSSGYGADRRRRERAFRDGEQAVQLGRLAGQKAAEAKTASNFMTYRNNPETVANRIREFGAEQRKIERQLQEADDIDALFAAADDARRQLLTDRLGYHPMSAERREELAVQKAWLDEHLRGWREVREQQIARGEATNYTQDTIAVGDFVGRRNGDWFPVLRVNKVSVTVPSPHGGWTGTIRYEHLSDHVIPGDARWDIAKAAAIKTGTLYIGACGPHESIKALMVDE